ncbi:hypothetical protein NY78_2359 [Desulfovibrio sp. TomC]|nr:hypothetical protein NY78_2359 [Desulfovibrio sp. TomC]
MAGVLCWFIGEAGGTFFPRDQSSNSNHIELKNKMTLERLLL